MPGGLNLKGVPVGGKRTEERAKQAHDILADVKKDVRAMGMPDYPQPSVAITPLSDVDLEALSDRELGAQLIQYTAYASYMMPKVAEVSAAYKIAEMSLKQIGAELKVALYAENVRVSEIDARVQNSPKYLEYEMEKVKLYMMREILTAHQEAYSKQASAISRVIEIKKLEHEAEHRSANVQNYKPKQGLPGSFQRRR